MARKTGFDGTGKTCKAVASNGKKCKGFAVKGSDFCFWHSPKHKDLAERASSKGGVRKAGGHAPAIEGNPGYLSEDEAPPPPKTLEEARDLLFSAMRAVMIGKLSPQRAGAIEKLVKVSEKIWLATAPKEDGAERLSDSEIMSQMIEHVAQGFGMTVDEMRGRLSGNNGQSKRLIP